MKPDTRKTWSYKGCTIVPINCQHPTWGQSATPTRFRTAYRNRYWRINFPDTSWIHVEFKSDARNYIDWDQQKRNRA